MRSVKCTAIMFCLLQSTVADKEVYSGTSLDPYCQSVYMRSLTTIGCEMKKFQYFENPITTTPRTTTRT